ncbi:hypothetical protein ACTD5D_21005 [Nocardia takedensis]|uniref:hypothetical protein n=1 Tax=Nocardia takedensis TaxID=259390 RepID=UPI003F77495C
MLQVREFMAPKQRLREREAELAMLTEFCRRDDSYLWIQGQPWAGKSALLATFTLDPPPDARVISFFVTGRLAAQSEHTAFTAAVLDQLAVLLPDHRARIEAAVINRDGLRNELLAIAARREAGNQRRLVLVVDGLDEDTGTPSIAGLLPTLPDENLRIVVSSRHGPDLLIPHGHPLATAPRYSLKESEFAGGIRDQAIVELDILLDGPEQHKVLLALITASRGLTSSELEDLTEMAPFEIDKLLRGVAGRSFRAVATSADPDSDYDADPIYVLAHTTLRDIAEKRLGVRLLRASVDRLHAWAEKYRTARWPAETPDFLLHRYFKVLDQQNDLQRVVELSLDETRHDRMRARYWHDWIALSEIRTVQQHIADQSDPDLLSTARLARYRDQLLDRNENVPPSLPALWARLGQSDRGEALARSISDPQQRAYALAQVAAVLAITRSDRAARLADDAEDIAAGLPDPEQHVHTLCHMAAVMREVDPDRSQRFIDSAEKLFHANVVSRWGRGTLLCLIREVMWIDLARAEALARGHHRIDRVLQAEMLACVGAEVAKSNLEHAGKIADWIHDLRWQAEVGAYIAAEVSRTDHERATLIGHGMPNPGEVANTFARIAEVLVHINPERARSMIDSVESYIHRQVGYRERLAEVLARLAETAAFIDADRAMALSTSIPDPAVRGEAFVRVVATVAGADGPRAEALAASVLGPEEHSAALARMAREGGGEDPARANRLAVRAESLVHQIPDPRRHVHVLIRIAEAIAESDPIRAIRLAEGVENRMRNTSGRERHADTLVRVAAAIADTDPPWALQLIDRARGLTPSPPPSMNSACIRVAEATARTDPDQAEAIAADLAQANEQIAALSGVAKVVGATDPARAGRLTARAEDILLTVDAPNEQIEMLACLADAMAIHDPERAGRLTERAEHIAREIANRRELIYTHFHSLVHLARAQTNPDAAGRIVDTALSNAFGTRGFPDPPFAAPALAHMAGALAATAPERAKGLIGEAEFYAIGLHGTLEKDETLALIATALSSIDPGRAETVARSISTPDLLAEALVRVAEQHTTGRCRRVLALAWSAGRWETPLSVLPRVDTAVLRTLIAEITTEI